MKDEFVGRFRATEDTTRSPATISVAALRRDLEAWVETLGSVATPTEHSGAQVEVRLAGQRYRFLVPTDFGTPNVEEVEPSTYVCSFDDESRVQLFSRMLEPAQPPFAPPSSGVCFRVDLLSTPMGIAFDQHPTLPRYVAHLQGFLDDRQRLEAYILTGTAVRRAQLVDSLVSMIRMPG